MSEHHDIRKTAAALAAKATTVLELLERVKGRLSANPSSVTRADLLEVQEALEAAQAASREAYLSMGLTPAAIRLIDEETARLRSVIVGGISADDLANSKIGEIVAGMRASRSEEGGAR